MRLDALIDFFQMLTEQSVERFPEFYAKEAWFKDPFNEARGVDAVQRIFAHMFRQVDEPRFIVTERLSEGDKAVLVWEFHFRRQGRAQIIRGASHLRFSTDGKVSYHRDYWDAAEELYMTLPVIGGLMRWLRKALAA